MSKAKSGMKVRFDDPHIGLYSEELSFGLYGPRLADGTEPYREVTISFCEEDRLFEIRSNDHLIAKIDL